ncbi:mesoderm induction early response protein 3 isoform X2 [Bombina bombina]|uniref:mesoderm induction early response protein 3 isoform X2 n=1 Tax=Bombina bombina TaxID=8345 RepID=UPI00235A75FB|nr:mesoderm induction early response protein 3 isoform X2 [Bombina bombina]
MQSECQRESKVGSLSSEDHDFDPTAEMLVHDYDDERTLEEEEMKEGGRNIGSEIEDLEREGSMPLEDLLAIYAYGPANAVISSSAGSSPSELADELPDMTLDKEEIAKDLLSGDDEETQSSADDLTPSVTSHDASDFFPRPLRSNTAYDGDKESESEDLETEYGNTPEDLRKEIMVGPYHQAEIPPYQGKYIPGFTVTSYEHEEQLLWSPNVLPEYKVKEFLYTISRSGNDKVIDKAPDEVLVKDNEQALHELFKCQYNIKEAMERYCCSRKITHDEITPWTEEECRNFEHALILHGKDFHLIQKNKVRSRTVAECVAFYYMWKKSERYDYFAKQTRFGKKRYNHHPGVTDYMDRLVDEAEVLGGVENTSALTCSNRIEPIPDSQLNILSSITANDLTALTHSVATVCNSSDVNCLNDGFPALDTLSRVPVNHVPVGTEDLLTLPSNGESDCFNLFETGFYPSELNPVSLCNEEPERPAKRIKMGISVPEPFINDVSVNSLGVDFENHTHHITSAKMAVSVADFSSLSASETNSFINSHTLHHTALQSE